jgi:hypothetical protein
MAISNSTAQRLIVGLASQSAGNEVATLLNNIDVFDQQSSHSIASLIVATAVSPTTDFGALRVGDRVVMIPAVAGNSIFYTVATAGTLPAAAIVGNMYIVLRAIVLPSASSVVL